LYWYGSRWYDPCLNQAAEAAGDGVITLTLYKDPNETFASLFYETAVNSVTVFSPISYLMLQRDVKDAIHDHYYLPAVNKTN